MDSKSFDETYVKQAAAAAGLALTPAQVPGVVMYLQMLAGFAALVDNFPLDETIENAAVFTPCSPPLPE